MWDREIRDEYHEENDHKHYHKVGSGECYRELGYRESLPKLIDEYNYISLLEKRRSRK
ncbi:MAG: hypothetical protein GH150_01070 [Hadesarchaea archaeon]|nr:hypothetical protein [Hadesarchaea archaeon]